MDDESATSPSDAETDKVETMKSLFGLIPDSGMTVEQVRDERLARYEADEV